MSPRSPNSCMTMAVDVSTNPMPQMKEMANEKPKAMPMAVSSSPQLNTCRLPRPKISRRMFHR